MLLAKLPSNSPSPTLCRRSCEQNLVVNKCGSYSAQYVSQTTPAFFGVQEGGKDILPCDVEETSASFRCMKRILGDKRECIKFCSYKPCVKDDYVIVQSHSIWPSLNALSLFKERLKSQVNPNIRKISSNSSNDLQDSFYIRANFLKVRIFFQDLSVNVVAVKPSYDLHEYLADLGGVAALWLGLSVLTFFDLLELIVDLILPAGRKNEKTTSKQESKHPEKLQPEEELKALDTEV